MNRPRKASALGLVVAVAAVVGSIAAPAVATPTVLAPITGPASFPQPPLNGIPQPDIRYLPPGSPNPITGNETTFTVTGPTSQSVDGVRVRVTPDGSISGGGVLCTFGVSDVQRVALPGVQGGWSLVCSTDVYFELQSCIYRGPIGNPNMQMGCNHPSGTPAAGVIVVGGTTTSCSHLTYQYFQWVYVFVAAVGANAGASADSTWITC